MARYVCAGLLAVLLALGSPPPAYGWGIRGVRVTAAYYPVYYTPAPAWSVVYSAPLPVYAEIPVVCPAIATVAVPAAVPVAPPVQVVPAVPYATPTPAPPSQTPEPAAPPSQTPEPPTGPGPKTAPKITESRSHGAFYAGKTMPVDAAASDLYRVGFWNLTGRDVTVKAGGQTHRLPRGRAVTLHLGRQFVWQLDQRAPQDERIPEDQSTLEIVIRQ